jgi:hypothetical protein
MFKLAELHGMKNLARDLETLKQLLDDDDATDGEVRDAFTDVMDAFVVLQRLELPECPCRLRRPLL